MSDFPSVFDTKDHSYLHLGSKKDNNFRFVQIHLSFPSLVLLGIVFVASVLEYETMKALCRGISVCSKPSLSRQVYPLLMLFPIFYSFEMLFLYYNDQWLLLWSVQIALTVSDALVWIYFLAGVNYEMKPHNAATQLSLSVKCFHILFNLFIESKRFNLRNLLFLAEDVVFCMICPKALQARFRKREFIGSMTTGAIVLLLTTLVWSSKGVKWSVK